MTPRILYVSKLLDDTNHSNYIMDLRVSPEIYCRWNICKGGKILKRRHEIIPSKTFIGIRIHWHGQKGPDCLNFMQDVVKILNETVPVEDTAIGFHTPVPCTLSPTSYSKSLTIFMVGESILDKLKSKVCNNFYLGGGTLGFFNSKSSHP